MATNPATAFTGQIATPDADYPYGSARDIAIEKDLTGTPFDALWVNDLFGFIQAVLLESGIVPNGTSETARNSQVLTGLKAIIGTLSAAELENAHRDVADLGSIVNGDENTTVTTRLGGDVDSVQKYLNDATLALANINANAAEVDAAKDTALSDMVADVLAVANQKIYATTQIQQNIDDLPSIVAASIATYVAYNPRGTWQTNTVYSRNDIWEDNGTFYLVIFDYTSGANVAADVATNNVILHQQKAIVQQVTNIANLRLMKPHYDGQIIELGYHNVPGYGGGKFRADLSDTASADNNGTVIVTASGGRRWKRIITGLVNIDDFGCVPNDGRDNTANMKKSLDNCLTVTASLGRYKIGELLLPASGAAIICYSGRAYNQTIHAKTIFEAISGSKMVFNMSNVRGLKSTGFAVDCRVAGAFRATHGFYADTANTNQNVIEDVSVHYADIAFGASGAFTFNSTMFRGAIANQGRTGFARLVDCNSVNCVAAGNIERPMSLLTGHNSNRHVNLTSEWNGEPILLYETSSESFIGGFFDRAYGAAFHFIRTKSTILCGNTIKRSGRNTAVAITAARAAAIAAGTDPDVAEASALIPEQRSHFIIEGINEGLVIGSVTTSAGFDDGSGSERTTLSPEHIFEWINAEDSIDVNITGNVLMGFRTSVHKGTLPSDKIIIENNNGADVLVLGQSINQRNGRQFQVDGVLSNIAPAASKTFVNVRNHKVDQYNNEFRELLFSVRRSDSGGDYWTKFNGILSREAGTPALKLVRQPGEIGATGSIAIDGTGTIADIEFLNYSDDGKSFNIKVTNKHATSNINFKFELH